MVRFGEPYISTDQVHLGRQLTSIGRTTFTRTPLLCWEVPRESHIWDEYTLVEEDFKDYLQSHPDLRTAIPALCSLFFVGTNETQVKAVILIHCEDTSCRSKAQKIIRESREWQAFKQNHPGFALMSAAKPPSLRALHGNSDSHIVYGDEGAGLSMGTSVKFGSEADSNNQTIPSLARLGPTIFHDGQPYTITVSHHLRNASTKFEESGDASPNESIHSSASAMSNDDEDAWDLIDEYDIGPDSCEASSPESRPTDVTTMLQEISPRFEPESLSYSDNDVVQSVLASHDTPRGQNLRITEPEPDCIERARRWNAVIGELTYMSSDVPSKQHDWSLIKPSDAVYDMMKREQRVNLIISDQEPARGSTRVSRAVAFSQSYKTVWFSTSEHQYEEATLSGSRCWYRLPGTHRFLEVLPLHTCRPVLLGECGSAVLDIEDGSWYGQIIAAQDDSNVAYVLPAPGILESIAECLGVTKESLTFMDVLREDVYQDHSYLSRISPPPNYPASPRCRLRSHRTATLPSDLDSKSEHISDHKTSDNGKRNLQDNQTQLVLLEERNKEREHTPRHDQYSFQHSGTAKADSDIPSRFIYTPINESSIRILSLHPGRTEDAIRGSLFIIDNLDECPGYEALSYTWGDPSPTRTILLTSRPRADETDMVSVPYRFGIGSNLHACLKSVRKPEQPLNLWVDSVCINQKDCVEKSVQVSRMSEIYQKAQRVVVWLGQGTKSSDLAMSYVRSMLKSNNFRVPLEPRCADARIISIGELFPFYTWADIFRRPYWSRLWILQELAGAREAIFYVGNYHITMADLRGVVNLACKVTAMQDEERSGVDKESSFGFGPALLHIATALALVDYASRMSANSRGFQQHRTLEELVSRTSRFNCSDPRDRLYALIGITSIVGPSLLTVDYSAPLLEVYKGFVELVITRSKSLDITLRRWAPPGVTNRLPSWVPTFDPDNEKPSTVFACGISGEDQVNAHTSGYNASGGQKPQVWFDESQGGQRTWILNAVGIELGTVTDVSTPMTEDLIPLDWFEMRGLSFKSSSETVRMSIDEIVDRLTLALDVDRDEDGVNLSSVYRHAFYSTCKAIFQQGSLDTENIPETPRRTNTSTYLSRVRDLTFDRRIFDCKVDVNNENLLGFVPRSARRGDRLAILFGLSVPVVLRSTTAGYYTIVGEAYVQGKMGGEAVYELDEDSLDQRTRTFQLV